MGKDERWALVYAQLNGGGQEKPWEGIPNEAAPGGRLYPLVEEIYGARERLRGQAKLSGEAERELERVVDGFERLCRCCGELMYQYGVKDGEEKM